jgi:long-chain acyl-CoA synthetase
MNIVKEIFAECRADHPAVITPQEAISYGELAARVEEHVPRLAAVSAPRIGLDCPDGITHIVLALAILKAGKCLVPLAQELSLPERAAVVDQTHLGAILSGDGRISPAEQAQAPRFEEAAFDALNAAFIRFSSGTTGRSKGVVISHESLRDRVTAANRGLQIGSADRVVWVLPMAHHFAVSIMLYLRQGATTLLPESHMAKDLLSMARTHGATVLYGAPFHHALLAAEPSGDPWPTLRLAVSTASALTESTAAAFQARYGVALTQGLGIIEVGMSCLNLVAAREKPTAVGRPLPDFEIETRQGEIWIQGPGMLDAYLNPWRTRDDILTDGWFHSGDLGHYDEEGDLHLDGRSGSVINVAGMKCFPEEVEAVLREHPGVKGARVLGRKHPRVGAIPVAEIIAVDPSKPPPISALVAHCRAALSAYKIPMDFQFVESISLTASGKIRRGEEVERKKN